MVGVIGFEPTTSCSQSRRATRLRYTPQQWLFYLILPNMQCLARGVSETKSWVIGQKRRIGEGGSNRALPNWILVLSRQTPNVGSA